MRERLAQRELITSSSDLRAFFHDSVARAMDELEVRADGHTVHYVVDLLAVYTRSDALYEQTREGWGLKPLALMLKDALDASSLETRNRALRRLGDVALFIGGFFAHSLSRSLVDLDYYVAMGGNAYGSLSDQVAGSRRGRVLSAIFAELAANFSAFVDVLGEVSDMAQPRTHRDVLRLYEIYLRTGSRRAERRLSELGLVPTVAASSRAH